MIDKWFISDVNKIFEHNSIAVFIDVSQNAKFLLGCLCNGSLFLWNFLQNWGIFVATLKL